MPLFGQVVVGPPGSGKTTYCDGMHQFLSAIGRKCSVVNLDPSNDQLNYEPALDIRDLMTSKELMSEAKLGPNGALLYAMELLLTNVDEFVQQVKQLGPKEYLLFDCPGQVELFTQHASLRKVLNIVAKDLDLRLVVVNLVDSFYITQPTTYISVVLLSLRTMLQMGLPQINVLSKIDALKSYGELPFRLEYYTEVQDLEALLPLISDAMGTEKLSGLSKAIMALIADFGLVGFEVLAIENKRSMISLLAVIDKANGYLFGSTEIGGDSIWVDAIRQGGHGNEEIDIHERWIEHKHIYDEAEKNQDEQFTENASSLADEYATHTKSFGPATFGA